LFVTNKKRAERDVSGQAAPALDAEMVSALLLSLPTVAERTVAAVIAEVPGYAGALSRAMATNIENAVQAALGAFLSLAEQTHGSDPSTLVQSSLEGAYALGRGEARSGRSMDALLAAYRVGARVSWREWSSVAVDRGLPAARLARFAELVFAYIDQLSAASVSGHTDELETSGRIRQRNRDRLAEHLLLDASAEVLLTCAERADWTPPGTLTAVLIPSDRVGGLLALLDPRTLTVAGDLAGSADARFALLLVPEAHGAGRVPLLRSLRGHRAVLGPARPWMQAGSSHRRALRGQSLSATNTGVIDTDEHLATLVLTADPDALAELRARALAPLAPLRPATAERLTETLRSWLLHHGRREDIAEELIVHPQTVRYRMNQLRELYGDQLTNPDTILELTLALALPPPSTGP
jgi:hypothetical protein